MRLVVLRVAAELLDRVDRILFGLGRRRVEDLEQRCDAVCVHNRLAIVLGLAREVGERGSSLLLSPGAWVLEHVHELLDDLHSIRILNRKAHQRALGVLARLRVGAAEQHDKEADAAALSDHVPISLVVCQSEDGSCGRLLGLWTLVAIEQRHERADRACLGDRTLRDLMIFGQGCERHRREFFRIRAERLQQRHNVRDATGVHNLVARGGVRCEIGQRVGGILVHRHRLDGSASAPRGGRTADRTHFHTPLFDFGHLLGQLHVVQAAGPILVELVEDGVDGGIREVDGVEAERADRTAELKSIDVAVAILVPPLKHVDQVHRGAAQGLVQREPDVIIRGQFAAPVRVQLVDAWPQLRLRRFALFYLISLPRNSL